MKVRPIDEAVHNTLQRSDDPDGLARKVEKQWIVDHKIGYSLQSDDGSRKACSHLVFRQGDFVDVGVHFEIFTRFSKGKKSTTISLAVQDIMRLETAHNITVRTRSYSIAGNNPTAYR